MRCLILLSGLLWFGSIQAQAVLADVEVRARWFELDLPVSGAVVYALDEDRSERNYVRSWNTDRHGRISFQWPVGETITLKLQSTGLNVGVQSATITVPPEGLTGPTGEITFQVPSVITYAALKKAFQMKYFSLGAEDTCVVVTTVTPQDKDLRHCPHGLASVQVDLEPPGYDASYYFGMIEGGPLNCKTDLLSLFVHSGFNYMYHWVQQPMYERTINNFRHPVQLLEHDRTTEDGGVIFLNVKVRDEAYTMIARDPLHPDRQFTAPRFYCHKGGFVNASPPHGIRLINAAPLHKTCAKEDQIFEEKLFNRNCATGKSLNETISQVSPDRPAFHHWNMLFQTSREFLHE